MMGNGSVLKDAILKVRRALGERGLSAKGTTFYKEVEDGNVIVLSLQKSVKSTSFRTELTLNYGVLSALIQARVQGGPFLEVDVMKAHWRKRLNEGGREKWFSAESNASSDELARLILTAAEQVLPELIAHSTNAALRDEWLAGASPGITNMQRLLYAVIVVNEIGPVERLAEIVEHLRALVRGGVHEGLVERQLAELGVQVPR
jgi:hypothetical protein